MTGAGGLQLLLEGLAFPECPRWRQGWLYFSEKRARRVVRVDVAGSSQTAAEVRGEPSGIGWTPDGRLLVVSMEDRRLLRFDDEEPTVVADLRALTTSRCNDMVVDGLGRAYIGQFGFDVRGGGEPAPTSLLLVTPDGHGHVVADDLLTPNGSVILPGGATLVLAETVARRLTAFDIGADGSLSGRRVFADVAPAAPDGICLDAEGAIWIADPLHREVVRVLEGGRVTDRIPTGEQGAFACELGGDDGRTLFVCTYTIEASADPVGPPIGRIVTARVDVPAAA